MNAVGKVQGLNEFSLEEKGFGTGARAEKAATGRRYPEAGFSPGGHMSIYDWGSERFLLILF